MDSQGGRYLNQKAVCSPLGATRLCQLVLGCAVVAMVIHSAGYSGSYGVFCMVVWCLCFTVTTLIFFLDATRLYGCLPCPYAGCDVRNFRIAVSVCSVAATLSYGAEVVLSRARPGQTAVGYMATVSGVLKVVQAFVACIIFGAVANGSEFTRYPATVYCVVVYTLCFALTSLAVLATVCGRTAVVRCMPFDRCVVVYTLLAILLYLSASVAWTVFCFDGKYGSPWRPTSCPRGKCPWDSKVVVAVFSFVNLALYTADLIYSQRMHFVSSGVPTRPRV
ncbi:hypothetical protein CRUP_003008 [Coryphaenoides rupestris]|nr:hypothetical protein CRUP_003008 [Coryphaenoides rupestris]